MDLVGILASVSAFVIQFSVAHPWVATVLMIMGIARLVFKPLCSFVTAYVSATPSPNDDVAWGKAQSSKVFKIFAYVIDWLGSIKIPK